MGIYVDPAVDATAAVKADAAWLYCRGAAVLGGRSAAAALGVKYLNERRSVDGDWRDFDPEPAVLIRPRSAGGRSYPGLSAHRIDLPRDEVVRARGMRVTSAARTGFDLGRWPASARPGWDPDAQRDLDQRVVLLDALCNRLRMEPVEIKEVASRHPRAAGLARLREAVGLVDSGAESPQETQLRLLLIRAGFPRPQTQVPVCDRGGRLYAQIDVGWPEWKVGLEYDGQWHGESEEQRSSDINRYADFHATGWRVVTVDKTLLYRMSGTLIARTWEYLEAAGAPV